MDVSTNCIEPHELVNDNFLLITEFEYGAATNNPSFKLARGFDYHNLFMILCFFHLPEPTTQSLLSDLEAFKMAPVDAINFTPQTLASYNAYVMQYKTYILNNADFINKLADPPVLSDQFIRNLSFHTNMLDVSKLKLKSFHAVLPQIADFTAPHIKLLEHYSRASTVSRPQFTKEHKPPHSNERKSDSQSPRIFTCWNCE